MAGAELDFAFVRVLAFGGLTKHLDRERDQAMLLGSFHFFSVRLAIGATALVAYYVQSFPAWPPGGLLVDDHLPSRPGSESTAAYAWDQRENG